MLAKQKLGYDSYILNSHEVAKLSKKNCLVNYITVASQNTPNEEVG
uniref:Uncharacterized protein n=1 Tax=Anguilla anguilla TaxID=7936 RepID=A0A0E9P985_ANGAN